MKKQPGQRTQQQSPTATELESLQLLERSTQLQQQLANVLTVERVSSTFPETKTPWTTPHTSTA